MKEYKTIKFYSSPQHSELFDGEITDNAEVEPQPDCAIEPNIRCSIVLGFSFSCYGLNIRNRRYKFSSTYR